MSSKNSLRGSPFLVVLAAMLLASSGVAAQQNNLAWSNVDSTQFWGCGGTDSRYDMPIQVVAITNPNYNAKALDIATGEYDQLLKLNNNDNTRCNEFSINACAMSGSENKEALYCVYTDSFTGCCGANCGDSAVGGLTYQLMRISKGLNGDAFETCVGQLQFDYNIKANAATFDADGKVMYVARMNYIAKYNIEELESMPVNQQPDTDEWCSTSANSRQIDFMAETNVATLTSISNQQVGADIVYSEEPFADLSTGLDHGYVVSIDKNCNLVYLYNDLTTKAYSGVLKANDQQKCIDDNKTGCNCWVSTGNNKGSFGAGWNYNGNIYVANNRNDLGVYKVKLFYDSNGKVDGYDLVPVSSSEGTDLNDGANCPKAEDPFPICGDPDDYRIDNRPMGKFEILPVGCDKEIGTVDPQEDNTALVDIFLEVHTDYLDSYTVVVFDMVNNEDTSLGPYKNCSEGKNATTIETSKFTFGPDSGIPGNPVHSVDSVLRTLALDIGLEDYKQNLPDDDGFKYDFCVRFGYKMQFVEGEGDDAWISYQDTRVIITKTITGFFGDWEVINIAVADKDGEQLEESNAIEVDLTAFLCGADNTTLGPTPQEPVYVLGQDMKLCVEVDAKDEYYINKFKDVNCTYQRDDETVVREIIQGGDAAQPAITRIAKYKHDSDYETGIHFTTVVTPDFVSNDNTQIDCSGEVSLYQITSVPSEGGRRQLEAPVERTVRFRMNASPSSGRELQEADEGFTASGEFSVKVIISSGGFSLGGVGASLVMMMGLVVVTLL